MQAEVAAFLFSEVGSIKTQADLHSRIYAEIERAIRAELKCKKLSMKWDSLSIDKIEWDEKGENARYVKELINKAYEAIYLNNVLYFFRSLRVDCSALLAPTDILLEAKVIALKMTKRVNRVTLEMVYDIDTLQGERKYYCVEINGEPLVRSKC